jgi:hypothetical protein
MHSIVLYSFFRWLIHIATLDDAWFVILDTITLARLWDFLIKGCVYHFNAKARRPISKKMFVRLSGLPTVLFCIVSCSSVSLLRKVSNKWSCNPIDRRWELLPDLELHHGFLLADKSMACFYSVSFAVVLMWAWRIMCELYRSSKSVFPHFIQDFAYFQLESE